jgi:transposase-like protein
MTDEDTRSLPAAAQAALRTRAVRAVLEGMTQAEAARVFRVHPNAVNRWIKRYREGGWAGLAGRGLLSGVAVAVRASRRPSRSCSSRSSSRWSATAPPISSVWRAFCGLAMRSLT